MDAYSFHQLKLTKCVHSTYSYNIWRFSYGNISLYIYACMCVQLHDYTWWWETKRIIFFTKQVYNFCPCPKKPVQETSVMIIGIVWWWRNEACLKHRTLDGYCKLQLKHAFFFHHWYSCSSLLCSPFPPLCNFLSKKNYYNNSRITNKPFSVFKEEKKKRRQALSPVIS